MASLAPSPASVAIIVTSTRTPRVGPVVAEWVTGILEKDIAEDKAIKLSLVDLATFKLPIYDEPVIPYQVPAQATFTHEHSLRWSAEISKHDAYILVIPEYNWGMSGGTKNAIDYLKNEWADKPAAIISYGIKGGSIASEQVNRTLEGLKLRVSPTRPQLAFSGGASPDVFAAMTSGSLGPDSQKAWESDVPTILKAFAELKEALKTKPAPEAK